MFTKENIQLIKGFIQFLLGLGLIAYSLLAKDLDPSSKSELLTFGSLLASVEIAGHVAGKVVDKR